MEDFRAGRRIPHVAAIAATLALVVSCQSGEPGQPGPTAGRPTYDGAASIDPDRGSVSASWTIRFVTDSSMAAGVSFLLNGRLAISRLEAAGLADFTSAPRREGSDWNLVDLRFDPPLPPGQTQEVRIEYAGVLYDSVPSDPINDISPEWIELGLDAAWVPVFSSFDQHLTGRLELTIPGEWSVVASGDVAEEGEVHTIVNGVPQIDFAFAAARRLERSGTPEVAVYHESASPETIGAVVEAAVGCRDWLESRFGAMPDLKLVLAPRDDGGYARKNYIVLVRVDEFPPSDLSRFLCHELAHFWSSAPSASTPDYWMTEAFAELVSAHHVRDVHGDSAYAAIVKQWTEQSAGLPPVWTDTAAERGSFAINYRKGPLVLSRLEGEIGRERFAEFLAHYMTRPTATTPTLLDRLEEVAGPDARTWFHDALAAPS